MSLSSKASLRLLVRSLTCPHRFFINVEARVFHAQQGLENSRNCRSQLVLPTATKLWVTGIPLCSITKQHQTKIKSGEFTTTQRHLFGNHMPTGTTGRSKTIQEERRSVVPVRRACIRQRLFRLRNLTWSACGLKPHMPQTTNRAGTFQTWLTVPA